MTLVGRNTDYAKDATIWHKHGLRQQLFGRAEIKLSSSVVEITEDHVVTEDKDGNRNEIPCDTVFCAAGLIPRTDVRNELRGITPYYYELGDCLKPGLMFDAVSQGHFIGRDI